MRSADQTEFRLIQTLDRCRPSTSRVKAMKEEVPAIQSVLGLTIGSYDSSQEEFPSPLERIILTLGLIKLSRQLKNGR